MTRLFFSRADIFDGGRLRVTLKTSNGKKQFHAKPAKFAKKNFSTAFAALREHFPRSTRINYSFILPIYYKGKQRVVYFYGS